MRDNGRERLVLLPARRAAAAPAGFEKERLVAGISQQERVHASQQ